MDISTKTLETGEGSHVNGKIPLPAVAVPLEAALQAAQAAFNKGQIRGLTAHRADIDGRCGAVFGAGGACGVGASGSRAKGVCMRGVCPAMR